MRTLYYDNKWHDISKCGECPFDMNKTCRIENLKGYTVTADELHPRCPLIDKNKIRFFECSKCGTVVSSDGIPMMCRNNAGYRISGICGGSFKEVGRQDYEEFLLTNKIE